MDPMEQATEDAVALLTAALAQIAMAGRSGAVRPKETRIGVSFVSRAIMHLTDSEARMEQAMASVAAFLV